MSRSKRIYKELEDVDADKASGVTLEVLEGLNHLRGTFTGPPDSPYAGGLFVVDIQVPDEYPFKPPKMRFETRVYHPNVSSQTGAICLDVLKDAWTPILTLKSSLLSLQSLLQSPQPDDPQDAVVAGVLLNDPDQFAATAKHWTAIYAEGAAQEAQRDPVEGPEALDGDTLALFEDMGFDRVEVAKVLRSLGLTAVRADDVATQDKVLQKLSM